MESSTTDVCEWCKRPMLPAGATITGQVEKGQQPAEPASEQPGEASDVQALGTQEKDAGAESGVQEGEAAEAAPAEPEREEVAQPRQEAAQPREEVAQPRQEVAQPREQVPQARQETPAAEQAEAEPGAGDVLRPLGGPTGQHAQQAQQASDAARGQPSHGVSSEATRTSVDISEYMGDDDSIFRPIKREDSEGESEGGRDMLKTGQRRDREEGKAAEIPENKRLGQCVAAGLIVSLVIALVQYLATGDAVEMLYVLRLGRGDSLFVALKYGIASGLVLGLGLGAILVRLKRGPFLGLIIGLLVAAGFKNYPWALVQGALTGILAGRFATVGLRRVVNV
jgi:hypothetical protein